MEPPRAAVPSYLPLPWEMEVFRTSQKRGAKRQHEGLIMRGCTHGEDSGYSCLVSSPFGS